MTMEDGSGLQSGRMMRAGYKLLVLFFYLKKFINIILFLFPFTKSGFLDKYEFFYLHGNNALLKGKYWHTTHNCSPPAVLHTVELSSSQSRVLPL